MLQENSSTVSAFSEVISAYKKKCIPVFIKPGHTNGQCKNIQLLQCLINASLQLAKFLLS